MGLDINTILGAAIGAIFTIISSIAIINMQLSLNQKNKTKEKFQAEMQTLYQAWMEGYIIHDYVESKKPLIVDDIINYKNLKSISYFLPPELAEELTRVYYSLVRYINYWNEVLSNNNNPNRIKYLYDQLPARLLDEFIIINFKLTILYNAHKGKTSWDFNMFYEEFDKAKSKKA